MPTFPDWEPVPCTSSRQKCYLACWKPLRFFPGHDCWGDLSGCDDDEPQKSLQQFIYRCYSHVRGRRFGSLTGKDKKYISYLGPTPPPSNSHHPDLMITFLVGDPNKPLFATGGWVQIISCCLGEREIHVKINT